jgi:mannan endo-1,4-beta-mannosidase
LSPLFNPFTWFLIKKMKNFYTCCSIIVAFILIISASVVNAQKPVNPDASPEAVQLLDYLYSISGKKILTGQHCAPLLGSTRLPVVHPRFGKYPALFGQDFGFSYPGYWDGFRSSHEVYNSTKALTYEELAWVDLKDPNIHYPVLK